MSQEKDRRKNRKVRLRYQQKDLLLLLVVLAVSLLVIGGVQLMMRSAVKKQDDGKILSGIYIGSTDVSGMTASEAKKAVQKELDGYAKETLLFQMENGKSVEASLEELGFGAPQLESVIKKAVQYGKSGSLSQNYKRIKWAEKGRLKKEFSLEFEVSQKAAEKILSIRCKDILDEPVNAAIVRSEDGQVTYQAEQVGEALNMKKTLNNVEKFLNNGWDGKGGKVEAVVEMQEPEITEKSLEEVRDLLGTFTTYYGSDGSGRAKNVESGAMHLNGILLQPGEELSANAAMEPYTEENGYAMAASYESNTVVETMGGGICQVSTTLYNALLYAELEIVERYPHSMLVSYVEPSMDAAIADDVLDLVFKNNQKTPVYIETVLQDGSLTFNIYGKETRDSSRTLSFVSEMTESKETEGKRFVATEDAIGYMGLQSSAHPEIQAQLWKVISENGEEVNREIVNYSQYVAAPETYGVGTASSNPEDTEKMNRAILTQNEEEIQKAMNEILYGTTAEQQ